jgi:isoleucyl-tRNA synthetase
VLAADGALSVELDPELDDDLRLEGRVLDLIHEVNRMRREAGLEVTDRIVLTLPLDGAALVDRFADRIKSEVLAVRIDLTDQPEPAVARA